MYFPHDCCHLVRSGCLGFVQFFRVQVPATELFSALSELFTVSAANIFYGLGFKVHVQSQLMYALSFLFPYKKIGLWLSVGIYLLYSLYTLSWLMQRWAIIRKRYGNLNLGSTSTATQLSEAQLAARHAMSLALDMPVKSLTANSSGSGILFNLVVLCQCTATDSSGLQRQHQLCLLLF